MPLDLSNFRVLGHVAGQGDVVVDANNWIAGPLAPSRIEGIAVQWPDKLPDLLLRYSVAVAGPRPTMGPLLEAGNFAGTRGRALPLVGATFELSGSAAHGQQLVVDSVFLGSPQLRAVGQHQLQDLHIGRGCGAVKRRTVDRRVAAHRRRVQRARERFVHIGLEVQQRLYQS